MDADTFRQTVIPLYRGMFTAAVAIVGDKDDAADAVQETMVKLWNNRAKLDEVRSLEAFVFSTLRNTAIDFLRRRPFENEFPPNQPFEPPEESTDDIEALTMIIESLPPNCRDVIKLNVFDGHTPNEIAKLTGLSPENIRQLLSRGRRKIKELYSKFLAT